MIKKGGGGPSADGSERNAFYLEMSWAVWSQKETGRKGLNSARIMDFVGFPSPASPSIPEKRQDIWWTESAIFFLHLESGSTGKDKGKIFIIAH